MSRYIDADDTDNITVFLYSRGCLRRIEAPTVDVAPIVHAHWVDGHKVFDSVCFDGIAVDKKMYFCSYCGRSATIVQGEDLYREYPFCNCGAKMDKEMEEDD